MKKTFYSLAYLSFPLLLFACSFNGQDGAPGPPGPPGRDGQDGRDGQEAYVFEYEGITFTSPAFEVFLEFPVDFQMLESDKVLVYFLWSNPTVDEVDIWRLLPQTEFTDFGTLIYNYDFTVFDVALFLDGNFNLNALSADYTDNWIARVLVIPAQFTNGRENQDIDSMNYQEVMEFYGLTDNDIIQVK